MQIDEDTRIIVHYNRIHNADQSIPPWVVKAKGQTFYVHHIDVDKGVGFSTKESPDSEHTKASLKFKGKLRIDEIDNQVIANIYI